MLVPIACPNPACARVSRGPEEMIGRGVRCRNCGQRFTAAAATVAADAAGAGETPPEAGTGARTDPFATLPAAFGRYRLLKLLGRGGMGAVYLAEDAELKRRVALKMPHFGTGENARRVERFLREARLAGRLDHPNIYKIFDIGHINGRLFLTMSLVQGRPLQNLIGVSELMSTTQAVKLITKIAHALEYVHRRGVVHRDLKPSNIMVTPAGEPVVTDFGLAKWMQESNSIDEDRLTLEGAMIGTPSYMSPEQVCGEVERIGPAADIYALGVILFELLTGEPPFRGVMASVIGQILYSPVPRVEDINQDSDARFDPVIQKAMAKDPATRYASMDEFSAALGEVSREGMVVSAKQLDTTVLLDSGFRSPKVWSIDQSPDGSRLVASDASGYLRFWNVADGVESSYHETTRSGPGVFSVRFSPDGRHLLTMMDDWSIRVRTAEGKELGRMLSGTARNRPAFSPDGQTIALARGQDLLFRSVPSCQPKRSIPGVCLHTEHYVVAFSPDCRTLFLGGSGRGIQEVTCKTGKVLRTLSGTHDTVAIAVGPGGQSLYAIQYTCGSPLSRWDLATGARTCFHGPVREHLWNVSVSPDGKLAAVSGRPGGVYIWDTSDPLIPPAVLNYDCSDVSFSRDGRHLLLASPQGLGLVYRLAHAGGDPLGWVRHQVGYSEPPFRYPADRLAARRVRTPDLSKCRAIYSQSKTVAIPYIGPGLWLFNLGCTEGESLRKGYALRIRGRLITDPYGMWGLRGQGVGPGIDLMVSSNGEFDLKLMGPPVRLRSGTHPVIRPLDEWNELTMIFHDGYAEAFVNGVAVCQPCPVPPATCEPPITLQSVHTSSKTGLQLEISDVQILDASNLPSVRTCAATSAATP